MVLFAEPATQMSGSVRPRYGFIKCRRTHLLYNRDVYITKAVHSLECFFPNKIQQKRLWEGSTLRKLSANWVSMLPLALRTSLKDGKCPNPWASKWFSTSEASLSLLDAASGSCWVGWRAKIGLTLGSKGVWNSKQPTCSDWFFWGIQGQQEHLGLQRIMLSHVLSRPMLCMDLGPTLRIDEGYHGLRFQVGGSFPSNELLGWQADHKPVTWNQSKVCRRRMICDPSVCGHFHRFGSKSQKPNNKNGWRT